MLDLIGNPEDRFSRVTAEIGGGGGGGGLVVENQTQELNFLGAITSWSSCVLEQDNLRSQ